MEEQEVLEMLHTFSGWVIGHKDHVTLLTAGVSALMAFAVVLLTAALAKDNRRLRKAGTEPDVVAYILPDQRYLNIPRSRHNPKILGVDDAEIIGDRITEVRPIPRNFFTQETERRIGELGASRVGFIVRDMLVHHAP